MRTPTIRIKHMPRCAHPYTAHLKGVGTYGWGNTPDEARAKLLAQLHGKIDKAVPTESAALIADTQPAP